MTIPSNFESVKMRVWDYNNQHFVDDDGKIYSYLVMLACSSPAPFLLDRKVVGQYVEEQVIYKGFIVGFSTWKASAVQTEVSI